MRKYKSRLIFVCALIAVLFVSNNLFYRFDLTAENRYTLSDNTKDVLKDLKEDIYIEVYLDGELPSSFMRLRNRIEELVGDCARLSNKGIHFRFLNPNAIGDRRKREKFIQQLVDKGVQPTNLNRKKSDESLSQQIIFPSMLIWNSNKEMAVNLLKNNPSLDAESNINNSIESLEYELLNAIKIIDTKNLKSIGFLTGHNEISKVETADIGGSLADFYNVDIVSCDDISKDYNRYSTLVIAQPRKDFTEKDKFAIDQFIMNGGSTLWLVDQVAADLDSLRYKPEIFAYFKPLNIEDMLFTYGVRINPNLVLDGQCVLIPVKTSLEGEAPKFSPAPWYYSPLVRTSQAHPIGKNINPVRMDFANTIDTVGSNKKIKKEVLLSSSKYTRLVNIPWPVSLDIVGEKMSPAVFNKQNMTLAVLMQGHFTSAFRHRMVNGGNSFLKESKKAKMIVVSDGDIIRNIVSGSGKNLRIMPLGYDRYSKRTYGNKAFLLNAINYLSDNSGLMNLRAREYKLRVLDKTRLKSDRKWWQYMNLLLPLFLLFIFSLVWYYIRKKRYSKR